MKRDIFPIDVKGSWIWHNDSEENLESYICFRKELLLDGTPGYAELWIAGKTSFHVYVNGRHVFYGESSNSQNNSYAYPMDITFCLQTGKNVIAVLVHNTQIPRHSHFKEKPGLWVQINMDGEAFICSDEQWFARRSEAFVLGQPRISEKAGFVEKFDFNKHEMAWNELFGHDLLKWHKVNSVKPLSKKNGEIFPAILEETDSEAIDFKFIVREGIFKQNHISTSISFDKIFSVFGVYCAQTFFYSFKNETCEFEFFSDDPYEFYFNGKQVKTQGISKLKSGENMLSAQPKCFLQTPQADPLGEIQIVQGWNIITITQQVEEQSFGFTLNLLGKSQKAIKLKREMDEDASFGWSLTGPLKVPFSNVIPTLNLSHSIFETYIPVDPVDVAAMLRSCSFEITSEELRPFDAIEISQDEYVIFALDTFINGFPEISFSGSKGDKIIIVYGETLEDTHLESITQSGRNVSTVILDGHENLWMSYAPRGVRYLMITAYQVSDSVRIGNVAIRHIFYRFENAGTFSSSDEVLNKIWDVSKVTLSATMKNIFLDSPTPGSSEFIVDSMIQSLSSMTIFGDLKLSRKALREFTFTQFETGEIPAMFPCDFYFNIPDFALLWPVWLQQYILNTGDISLIQGLLPHLLLFFNYLEQQTVPDSDVLCDLDSNLLGICFLDHDKIDRNGVVTGLNAIYCRSLLSSASLLEETNNRDKALEFRKRASQIANTIRELTWNEEKGLFADSWTNDGMSESFSSQTNILAIYGGIAINDQITRIMGNLYPPDKAVLEDFPVDKTISPYFEYFVLETVFALGERKLATEIIKKVWGGMLKHGVKTWPELYCPNPSDENYILGRTCCGYGVSPVYFFFREIAGIRPASPGFSSVYFNPVFGAVDSVKVHIPTPHGRINVEWQCLDGQAPEIILDANYPLDVIPLLDPSIASEAIFHVSDDITIRHH